jgi:hypothetical protein
MSIYVAGIAILAVAAAGFLTVLSLCLWQAYQVALAGGQRKIHPEANND